MTLAFAPEKLLVYQKSLDFADAVCAATRRFPRGYFFFLSWTDTLASLAEALGPSVFPQSFKTLIQLR